MGPIGVGHCQTIGVGLVSSPKQQSATKGNEPFGRPNWKAGGAHRSVFAFADGAIGASFFSVSSWRWHRFALAVAS